MSIFTKIWDSQYAKSPKSMFVGAVVGVMLSAMLFTFYSGTSAEKSTITENAYSIQKDNLLKLQTELEDNKKVCEVFKKNSNTEIASLNKQVQGSLDIQQSLTSEVNDLRDAKDELEQKFISLTETQNKASTAVIGKDNSACIEVSSASKSWDRERQKLKRDIQSKVQLVETIRNKLTGEEIKNSKLEKEVDQLRASLKLIQSGQSAKVPYLNVGKVQPPDTGNFLKAYEVYQAVPLYTGDVSANNRGNLGLYFEAVGFQDGQYPLEIIFKTSNMKSNVTIATGDYLRITNDQQGTWVVRYKGVFSDLNDKTKRTFAQFDVFGIRKPEPSNTSE